MALKIASQIRLLINIGVLKILLLSCCGLTLAADSDTFRFDSWTTDSGLPQNSILSIIQSQDGYLWFTTFDGLVRFDGVKFTVFDKNNTKGITGNRFVSVFEDSAHSIWSGTDNGEVFRYREGKFQRFNAENGIADQTAASVNQSPDGKIRILRNGKQFVLNSRNEFEADPAGDQPPIDKIYWGASGRLWVQEADRIYEIWQNQKISYPFRLQSNAGVYEDKNGALWLGENTVFYRLQDGQVTRFDRWGAQEIKETVTLKEPNKATYLDGQGLIWSGAARLSVFDPQTGKINEIPASDPTSMVSAITGDREGNVWIGTNGHGLTRASRRIISTYSAADNMKIDNVYPMIETSRGEVWIGAGQTVKIIDGKVFNLEIPGSPEPKAPQAFYEDREQRLWVANINGVGYYKNGKYTDLPAVLRHPDIVVIHEDRSGNLWFGSGIGLIKWKDEIETIYTTKDGLPNNGIRDIYEDERGVLWLGTYGGLVKFENNQFTTFSASEGLAGNHIRTISGEPDGTIWIGTYDNGLSRFKDGKFTNYNTSNGLFNNGVFRILDDGLGNFWMSSNRGIYRVAKQQLNDYAAGVIPAITSTAYGREDGMLSTECNGGRQPAGFKAPDGKLWFPTQKGAVVIDPAAVKFNSQPPSVAIENVEIDNKPVEWGEVLRIEPGQSIVQIDYTGLSLIKSEQVRFKYKIEGLDSDWIDADTRRSAFYSYLPAGNYVFTVIAANADGVWNKTGASLKIRVLPPFWKTWWFSVLVVLLLIGAAYYLYRRRTLQLLRERQAQEMLSRRLIESQETERKRLAGELHDSLSQNLVVIKNRAMMSLAEKDSEIVSEQIEEIAHAASQTIAEIREIAYNLRPLHIDRLGLTEAVKAMIKKVSSNNLQIEAKIDNINNTLSPEMEINLYRILQESLNNIVKHSEANKAAISIEKSERIIHVTISDNGHGFEANRIKSGASPNHGGLGLSGIYERARILGCVPRIESSGEKGTIIELNIPISKIS